VAITILYCGKCTERIPQKDHVAGKVLEFKGLSYCGKCATKVRAELEQDPEFQAAELAKTRAASKVAAGAKGGTTSRLAQGSMSGTGLFPSPSGKRSRTTVTMTPPAAQHPGSTSGRVGTKRRAGSGTNEPSERAPGIPLPWAIAGGLGLVAVVAIVALWATRPGPQQKPGPGPEPVKPPTPVEVDVKLVTLTALAERHVAFGRENPQAFSSQIERWRQFALEAAAYPKLVQQANDSIKAIEGQLEQAASRRFEELRARAAEKVNDEEFEDAISAWAEFEAELKTPKWGMKVIEQQDQLRTQKKEHEAKLAASFTRGEIPTEGYLANLFDGRSLEGWHQTDEGVFGVKTGGVIEAANGSVPQALAHPDIIGLAGKHVLLKDFYFAFQFKLLEGELQYLFRMPLSLRGEGGGAFTLSPKQGRFKFGNWYTAHTVVRGSTVQFWVDGALSLNTMENIKTPEGRVMFAAARGDRYQLRNLQLRVLVEGADYVPGVVPVLTRTTIELLKHATSMGDLLRLSRNCDAWTLGEGVVTMLPGPKAEEPSFVLLGEPEWRDYVFRFDISGLEGELGVVLRNHSEKKQQGEIIKIGGKDLPDKAKWYTIAFDLNGKVVKCTVDGVAQNDESLEPPTGRVGLLLFPGAKCKVRNLVVEVAE